MPGELSLSLQARLALEQAGFGFTHSLGQNFIFDEELLEKIASCAGADEGVNVLEIGPGAGMLTAIMARRGAKVLAIELDRTLEPVLDRLIGGFDNVRIIYADALKTDLGLLCSESFGDESFIICANLPYYITADFIMKAVTLARPAESVTLMLQKEAAQRVLATPGEEGWCALSAVVSFACEGRKLFDVPRDCFTPAPHVDSALIRLDRRSEKAVPSDRERAFVRFIKSAFSMRRKTLVNNLSSAYDLSKALVAQRIEGAGFDPRVRGEALSITELSRVFTALTGDV